MQYNGKKYTTFIIKSFKEYHEYLSRYYTGAGRDNIFRGQGSPKWDLIPKAFRDEYKDICLQERLNNWRRNAVLYENRMLTDIQWKALAQHHGLATNLTDWTYNPLIALFFACEYDTSKESDYGMVFAVNKRDIKNQEVKLVEADTICERLFFQDVLFIEFSDSNKRISEIKDFDDMEILLINPQVKAMMIRHLDIYGISYNKIYPGLEGLAKYWNSPNSIWKTNK